MASERKVPPFDHYATPARISESAWVVLGKGPTFDRRGEFLSGPYRTLGLNHVCRHQPVELTHATDLEVLDQCPEVEADGGVVVVPYYPHIDFRPQRCYSIDDLVGKGLLQDRVRSLLGRLLDAGRLFAYRSSRSSRWPHPAGFGTTVTTRLFSAVAACDLLAAHGVRKIRTLGVDGGTRYSPAFGDLKPLANGRSSFDGQRQPLRQVAARRGVSIEPLCEGSWEARA